MELGFAVKILGPDGRGMKTQDARRPQNHPSLAVSLEHCTRALEWLDACDIRFWRLSSDLAPYATHPERPEFHDAPVRYATELAAFGAQIRARAMRVTLHPSQYILLSSPDPGVTARSLADLDVQAALLDGMGVGPEGVIVLHCGGRYDDPEATAARIIERILALPEPVRRRLVLENDDRVWDASETLAICEAAQVPMVFDFHHHRCLNRTHAAVDDILPRVMASWPAHVPPKVHLSSGRSAPDDRAHADGIADADWGACAAALVRAGADADVMIEAKAKDHALLDLAARIAAGHLPRPPALAHLPTWPAGTPIPA